MARPENLHPSPFHITETSEGTSGVFVQIRGPQGSVGWFEGVRADSPERDPHDWEEAPWLYSKTIHSDWICRKCGIHTFTPKSSKPETKDIRANRINCSDFLAISTLHQ